MRRMFALESEQAGQTQVEREHIIWAKLKDTAVLKEASRGEKQEQVSVKIPKVDENFCEGVIRIRKTEDAAGEVSYVQTLKQHHPDGKTETNVDVSEDLYVQLAGLASEMVSKHRYVFPIEGTDLFWEVDAAPDGKGGYHEWVRIELEVTDLNAELPQLPFETEEVVLPFHISGEDEDEWRARNDELFQLYFVKKGPLVGYTKPRQETQENTVAADAAEEATEESEQETEETNGE